MKVLFLCIALILSVRGKEKVWFEEDFEDDSTFEEYSADAEEDSKVKRKNEKILRKYNQVLPELLPENFATDQGNSDKKLLKLIKKLKRRKNFFKSTCGRKYSIIEQYLEKQLNKFHKKSLKLYLNNCTSTSVNRNDAPDADDVFRINEEDPEDNKRHVNGREIILRKICLPHSTVESDGSVTMCKECIVQKDLGASKFPRYINEITCGDEWQSRLCFSGEGLCVQNSFHVTFLEDVNNVGFAKLYEWRQYPQPIERRSYSVLRPNITYVQQPDVTGILLKQRRM